MIINLQKQLDIIEQSKNNYTSAQIYKLTDLTLLNKNATDEQILSLFDNAVAKKAAAICLYPDNFKLISNKTSIKKATVVNFPTGNNNTLDVINEIKTVIETYNIDEIDYVFSYKAYLANDKEKALEDAIIILKTCKKYNKICKIIIESGAYTSNDTIYELSSYLAKNGFDFIKTSTGKINEGASLDAVYAILNAIKDTGSKCGIKVSGGVRTFQQANTYIKLAESILKKEATPDWFRIGASKLA